jgi:hypothetical protein
MWRGGGYLYRGSPEETNTQFSAAATAHWQKREESHPPNYSGFSHAKEESLCRNVQ